MKNLKLLALLMTTGIALSGINAANAEDLPMLGQ